MAISPVSFPVTITIDQKKNVSLQRLGIRSDNDAQFAFVFPTFVDQGEDVGSQGFGHLG